MHASSAALFKVASNFSTLLSSPHCIALSLTFLASGGNGNRMESFFKNPSTADALFAPFSTPIVKASFSPLITSSLERVLVVGAALLTCSFYLVGNLIEIYLTVTVTNN